MDNLLKLLEIENLKCVIVMDSYLSEENVEKLINVLYYIYLLIQQKGKDVEKEVIVNRSDRRDDYEEEEDFYISVSE